MDVCFTVLCVTVVSLVWVIMRGRRKKKSVLDSLPSPDPLPFLGNIHQINPGYKVHIKFSEWAKIYGPIYKINLVGRDSVVVTGFREIYDVLVTKGRDFGGRSRRFRITHMMANASDMMSLDYGAENVYRRKLLHGHLKQYGEGIRHIEDATRTIVSDMIEALVAEREAAAAIDVKDRLQDAIIDLTYVLILGEVLEDKHERRDIAKVVEYMVSILSASGNGIWLDIFPWLRFFGNQTFRDLVEMRRIQRELTGKWRGKAEVNQSERSIIFKLLQIIKGENPHNLDDKNVTHLTWQLMLGATSTTVATLSTLFQVLAHHPQIQNNIYKEILEKLGQSSDVCFKNKDDLPYCYATILEATRFATVLPLAVPRRAMVDTSILGQSIPKDTLVWNNLWGLHHDPDIWGDPFAFRPERFLDADGGALVPADHPLRKASMAFSAGPRVCTGEMFAMTRMFLILVMVVRRLRILPEEEEVAECGDEENAPCDPRNMKLGGVLYPQDFKVRLIERD